MKIKSVKKISTEDLSVLNGDLTALRQLREPVLKAFDIYKSNVYYGVIGETAEEHDEIMAWYKDLCDLQPNAIKNVPEKIKKYMR